MRRFLLALCLCVVGCIPLRVPLDTHVDPTPQVVPTPQVEPEVVPAQGRIKVLIVDKVNDRVKPQMLPYVGIWNSFTLREYLNKHCAKEGTDPGWRWFDPGVKLVREKQVFQEMLRSPRTSTPWIYIYNMDTQTLGSGPLSYDENENLQLLQKWGGP